MLCLRRSNKFTENVSFYSSFMFSISSIGSGFNEFCFEISSSFWNSSNSFFISSLLFIGSMAEFISSF